MTIACTGLDTGLGVAIRLSGYLDCQARALGENGFQALAGGPVQAGLLSGLVTIFVALIGYRLILGQTPDIRDGIGWVARLGIVLALVTSWPAVQTVIFSVAVDGPVELAGTILPAVGLSSDALDARIQSAYDTMRLGMTPTLAARSDAAAINEPQARPADQNPAAGQPATTRPSGSALFALPQTASLFALSTTGIVAALRIATGFLLAVGPLAILSLLFDATLGVFSGWVRALAGAALGTLGATIVTSIGLISVEQELAHVQRYSQGMIADVVDPQALTTIVLVFGVVMLATIWAAARMGSAFRLAMPQRVPSRPNDNRAMVATRSIAAPKTPAASTARSAVGVQSHNRAAGIADALAVSVRREHASASASAGLQTPSRSVTIASTTGGMQTVATAQPLGVAGRRSIGRRTRSATARDRGA